MAYLAKQALVNALKIVKDAEVQVSTPCLSAIQYFIALDRFYHQRESETQKQNLHIDENSEEQVNDWFLDCSSKIEKKEFISYVSEVISLDDGNYFKTFKELYEGKKAIQNSIQSNFFGGSSVDISRKSPDKVVYPQQDKRPLFYCLKGNVYRKEDYYDNLQYYITTQEAKFALAIWLLRKDSVEELDIESIRKKLTEKYTQRFVDILIPQENISYDDLKESLELSTSQELAKIYKTDFLIRQEKEGCHSLSYSHQQIFYGAPGTGKSHKIKENEWVKNAEEKKLVFRTTFHPDSDYSTFVGAYKPMMKPVADKYKAVAGKDEEITYSFVPQAFLQSYVAAWKNQDEKVFLIIEEINRGNCAQIFGDLFQLLDRDENGVSEYKIKADADIKAHLEKELGQDSDGIKDGELCLPKNLYIWATMNTSDQSLFPIDSAFKRRWDWKYVKIKNEHKDWKVDIDIKTKDSAGNETTAKLDWYVFIDKINEIIASMTSSADKQLGYFFCKPKTKDSKEIDAETFVSKVIFYLWNDVFKDYAFEDASLFQYTTEVNGNKETKDLTFPDFYNDDESINTTCLTDFIEKVMNWKKGNEDKE